MTTTCNDAGYLATSVRDRGKLNNVFAPDRVWYEEGRVPASDAPRPYALPDLTVEVRSPSTWRVDIGRKKGLYEAKGLPELWLVDTAADTVLGFRRSTAS